MIRCVTLTNEFVMKELAPEFPRSGKPNSDPTMLQHSDERCETSSLRNQHTTFEETSSPSRPARTVPVVVWIAVAWAVGTLVFELTATG